MSDVLQVLPYSPQPLSHLILFFTSDPLLVDTMTYVKNALSRGTLMGCFGSHTIGPLPLRLFIVVVVHIIEVQQLIILMISALIYASLLFMTHYSYYYFYHQ